MITKMLPLTTLGLAGAVSLGLLGVSNPAVSAGDAYLKRDDRATTEVVLVDDDDDDDSNSRSRSRTTAGTGSSRSRADGTNSRYTAVSRDRDRSRGDKTKDWTRDGGDRTRDLTPNLTNDRSRQDTRR